MSIVGLIFVAQAAAVPAADSPPPPDIEIRAHADVHSLDIRSNGAATLTLHAEPGDAPPAKVERSLPAGRTRYHNLSIDIRGIARLTAPEPIAVIQTKTGDPE